MRTYTIGEAAERSGFAASTLRYYEGIGLVEPFTRTEAGYRLYDDRALARLAFIARAKQLGCSLGEITDLVAIWDAERCGPVQRRFHELITGKIAEAQRQMAEMAALTGQLQQAASHLAEPASDGPCGESCACMNALAESAESRGAGPAPVRLVADADDSPVACTLPAEEMPDRITDWQAALRHVTSRERVHDGGLRATFDSHVDVGRLASLAAAEQGCCSFFAFTLTIDVRGTALEVRAPDGAAPIVDALFGVPA